VLLLLLLVLAVPRLLLLLASLFAVAEPDASAADASASKASSLPSVPAFSAADRTSVGRWSAGSCLRMRRSSFRLAFFPSKTVYHRTRVRSNT
jgi:hypothetical protein